MSCQVDKYNLRSFMHLSKYLFLLGTLILFTSCKKKEQPEETYVSEFKNGLLIVNEGLFHQNNSSLSWLDFSSLEVNNEIYQEKNSRQLGDTGNDIIKYGSKVYVVVNVSSIIEVLDAKTGKSIKQIPMVNNSIPKQPRYIKPFGDKLFISCFDGYVDIIDTLSLEVTNRIKVGSNPDAMNTLGNQLFVSNTGGLNYPNVDSTVSIIDMNQMSVVRTLTVGKNPRDMQFDQAGNLYVITARGLNTYDSQIVRLRAGTYERDSIYMMNATNIEKMGTKMLVLESDFTTSALHLFDFTTKRFEVMNFIPAANFTTLYKIQYNPVHQQILCFDAMNFTNLGYLHIYSTTGTLLHKKKLGLNPSKATIYE